MKLAPITALFVAFAAILAACSDDTLFTVEGSFADGRDHDVTMGYFDGSAYRETSVTSINGSFRFTGQSAQPAFITISEQGRTPLVSVIAANGDEITVAVDAAEPLNSKAEGNSATKAFNGFVRDNAAAVIKNNIPALNAAIAEYIGSHPDNVESTAMLTSLFRTPGYEMQADSLLRLLGPKARSRALLSSFPAMLATQLSVDALANISSRNLPGPDSTVIRILHRNSSLTMYAFADDETSDSYDSAAVILRKITERLPRKRFHGIELSSAHDSLSWAVRVKKDTTAKWDRTWSPLLIAERQWKSLAIPSRPFFIIVDSTGTQRLRTPSAARAEAFVDKYLAD